MSLVSALNLLVYRLGTEFKAIRSEMAALGGGGGGGGGGPVVGEMTTMAKALMPRTGYLPCEGGSYLRSAYPDLAQKFPTPAIAFSEVDLSAQILSVRYIPQLSLWVGLGIDYASEYMVSIFSSSDGVTWTPRHPVNADVNTAMAAAPSTLIAYTGSVIVVAAAEPNYDYWTSSDGLTWTTRNLGGAGAYSPFQDPTHAGGGACVLLDSYGGSNLFSLTPAMVESWRFCTYVPLGEFDGLNIDKMAYCNGLWLGTFTNIGMPLGYATSTDPALEWTQRTPGVIPTNVSIHLVASNGSGFVLASMAGAGEGGGANRLGSSGVDVTIDPPPSSSWLFFNQNGDGVTLEAYQFPEGINLSVIQYDAIRGKYAFLGSTPNGQIVFGTATNPTDVQYGVGQAFGAEIWLPSGLGTAAKWQEQVNARITMRTLSLDSSQFTLPALKTNDVSAVTAIKV